MRRCIVFSLCLAALSASATPVTSKAAADDALLRACQAKGECQDGTLPAAVPITFSRRVDRDESGAPSLFSLESAFGVLSAEDNALVAGLLTQVRESLPATATTTFAQGCDLEDGGAACVKVRLPLQTAADCAAGLHPLCCPLYLTIDGSSEDPADLVWDGTAVVNDYFTNFTDRTLAEWRASGCVPSEDTSPRIFAVDADGAWALTTERTAATVTWEYFPTAVSHIDHLDEPNEPSGNTTAEATTDGQKKSTAI
ncbi:hypothetical protein AGDE_16847 [Angomonas deanei]|uniref:Uncharacterized protein n=1 Tax=Angomonas deanei TaxID=59799 RepID=A0A7G2CB57_9TRYP|nr:hypothetical protein AGDE_16847 [Angomonas deanei]CAD2216144.1 hypothetical protein, conserved [Angomonas deanei]|eukprot:EPY16063.1 hypothetical protein AGDE_16847 [Angomonas deanei]